MKDVQKYLNIPWGAGPDKLPLFLLDLVASFTSWNFSMNC